MSKKKKLKECPNCGKEISQSAKRCPYCDAKQKKKLKIWQIIVAVIVIFLIIASFGGGEDDEKKPAMPSSNESQSVADNSKEETSSAKETEAPKETETELEWLEVSSTDLIASYEDNQVKCKQLYDGKWLAVTGKVSSVGTDVLDKTYVCLGSDDEYTFVGVQCYTENDEFINMISELSEGDTITVYGKGDCGSMSFTIDNIEAIEAK